MAGMRSSEMNMVTMAQNWIKNSGLKYSVESEVLNPAISGSLKSNPSKTGKNGGGKPDITFYVEHNGEKWFGIIELKNKFDKLEKLTPEGLIDNQKKDGSPAYGPTAIGGYAVNGAHYYAKNAFNDTEYNKFFVIGANGYTDDSGKYKTEVSVYVLSNKTNGEAVKYKNFTNLSFLNPDNISETFNEISRLALTDDQRAKLRDQSEQSLDKELKRLNELMYKDLKIDANLRVNLLVSLILAALGDETNNISPLDVSDLRGSSEADSSDADVILRKVKTLFNSKQLPKTKIDQIVNALTQTIKFNNFEKIGGGTESKIKTLYREINNNLISYARNTEIDFSGAVYNVMTDWMQVPDSEKMMLF